MGYLEVIEQLGSGSTAGVSSHTRWHSAYREIARITYGLMPDDPRLGKVLAAIDECDRAFFRGDWSGFQQGFNAIRTAIVSPEK